MLSIDETLVEKRTDPANRCSMYYSHTTTERFKLANQELQNYQVGPINTLALDQVARGVT